MIIGHSWYTYLIILFRHNILRKKDTNIYTYVHTCGVHTYVRTRTHARERNNTHTLFFIHRFEITSFIFLKFLYVPYIFQEYIFLRLYRCEHIGDSFGKCYSTCWEKRGEFRYMPQIYIHMYIYPHTCIHIFLLV